MQFLYNTPRDHNQIQINQKVENTSQKGEYFPRKNISEKLNFDFI